MADKKTTTAATNDKVTIRLPKINKPGAPQEEFYSLNFYNYRIKRGVNVEVPKALAEIIENNLAAEDQAITYVDENALKEPSNNI